MYALAASFELLLLSRRHDGCPVVFGTPEPKHYTMLTELRILERVKRPGDISEENQVRKFDTSMSTSQLGHVRELIRCFGKREDRKSCPCASVSLVNLGKCVV